MSAFAPRLTPAIIGLLLSATSSLALAQVTLNLATAPPPQQTDCVAVTDANGLILGADGSTMQATGVTFNGTGCGGGSNFNAQLSIQGSNPVAGTPVNVVWSAGQAATQCVYGGAAPAGGTLAGWPFGASACQGAACSTSHTTPVTPSSAGAYNISIACTNASGIAQGSLTASAPAQPPQPDNFALTAPASASIGAAFQVSWAVTGATSCSGSASLGGSSVSLPGWTDVTTATSPRSVTAAQVGSYTLNLACSNAAGTIHSQAATVVVSGGQETCPGPGGIQRQTSGVVVYTAGGGQTNRDYTSFAALWGHNTAADTEIAWPGRQPSSPIPTIARNQFIAAKFTVPADASPLLSGFIQRATYSYGISMTAAYSTTCGDFNPTNTACKSVTTGTPLPFPSWNTIATGSVCHLLPGQTYYLNIMPTDPTENSPTCSSGSPNCPMGTTNYVNGR
jgi:hypothetical protein